MRPLRHFVPIVLFAVVAGATACAEMPPAPTSTVPVSSVPLINEVLFNPLGVDQYEYLEFTGAPSTDYSGYAVVQIEGDSGANPGDVDGIYSLGTTDGSGRWWTGFLINSLENGTMSFLLVRVPSPDLSLVTDVDQNDDGVIDGYLGEQVVDSIAFSDGGVADRTYGSTTLDPFFDGVGSVAAGASRIPDRTDTDATSDWKRNDPDGAGISGFVGTPDVGEALNTPGTVNTAVT